MSDEFRAQERGTALGREDWITKFVNAVVREFRPGLDRMVAVTAARDEWPRRQGTSAYAAAKEWASRAAAD